MHVAAKCMVLLLFLGLVAACLVSIPSLREGLPLADLTNDGSYLHEFYRMKERAFDRQLGELMMIHFSQVDQSDPLEQVRMLQAWKYVLDNSTYASPLLMDGGESQDHPWLSYYHRFALSIGKAWPCAQVLSNQTCNSLHAPPFLVPKDTFFEVLHQLLAQYPALRNQMALRESPAEPEILASYFPYMARYVRSGEDEAVLKDAMQVEKEVNLDIYEGEDIVRIHSRYLLFAQQGASLWREAGLNLVFAGVGVMALSWLTLVHPTMVLLMGLVVIAVDGLLFGLMFLLRIRFNR